MDPLRAGYSMPVTGELFAEPPWDYTDVRMILVRYEADEELVRRHLPDGVEPLDDPVQCIAWVCFFPFTPFGPYHEVVMMVRAQLDGVAYNYAPLLYVDSDAAMCNGREVWGFPKKFAELDFTHGGRGKGFRDPMIFTLERPLGKRLLTVTMTPERLTEPRKALPALSLRHIPSAEPGKPPSICELVATDTKGFYHTTATGRPNLWEGRASVTMDSASVHDPVSDFAPTRILDATYGVLDMTLPLGTVVKDYLRAPRARRASRRR